MADFKYYLGPWVWQDKEEPCWKAPIGTKGLLDLRPVETQGKFGILGEKPIGFFCVDPNKNLDSSYAFLGRGDLRSIKPRKIEQDAWKSLLGFKPNGETLVDLIWDHFLTGSDPDGLSNTSPILPSLTNKLELRLKGYPDFIKSEKYKHGKHRHSGKVEHVLKRDFKKLYESNPDNARRVLDFWLEQYKIPKDQWRKLVPSQLQNDIPGPLPHQTTITESFNKADSSTVGPDLTWNEIAGAWSVLNNELRLTAGSGSSHLRAEHDLSSDDQQVSLDLTILTASSGASVLGTSARFSASETTTYSALIRFSFDTGLFSEKITKFVTGTQTDLSSYETVTISLPDKLTIEANGSTIRLLINDSQITSLTDSSITGNVRTGIFGFSSSEGLQGDNFVASDISSGNGGGVSNPGDILILL